MFSCELLLDSIGHLKNFDNGSYRFKTPENFTIILKNFNQSALKNKKILVCFTSAVSNRDVKKGPFHSGFGISESSNLPLVSISDYLVTNNKGLSLAWYAGCDRNPDFQSRIANYLDEISTHYDSELILLGGSGAGFAGLAVASLLKCNAFVITMNPQTSIEMYFKSAVDSYLNLAVKSNQSCDISSRIKFLKSIGIITDLCNIKYSENIRILYLNNATDEHHITRHLQQFFTGKDLFPMGNNSYISNNIGLYLGTWGEGHIPPNVTIINELLKLVCSDSDLFYILRSLENGLNGLNLNQHSEKLITLYDFKVRVFATKQENTITPKIQFFYRGVVLHKLPNWMFAVYILNEKNEALLKTGYSKDIAKITCSYEGKVRIKIFVKDRYGRKITGASVLM